MLEEGDFGLLLGNELEELGLFNSFILELLVEGEDELVDLVVVVAIALITISLIIIFTPITRSLPTPHLLIPLL